MRSNEDIKMLVLEKISGGGEIKKIKRGMYSINGSIVHVRYRSGTKNDGETVAYNINRTTLKAEFELWIWGDGSYHYLIPISEIKEIYETPTRYIDASDTTRCVAEVRTTTHKCRYNTEGKLKDFSRYFNSSLTSYDVFTFVDEADDQSASGEFGGAGEGEAHRALKEYIAHNPHVLGLDAKLRLVKTEFKLSSGDECDILFTSDAGDIVSVEVKSRLSSEGDIRRGLFQCIKYNAVILAMNKVKGVDVGVISVLALGATLPSSLLHDSKVLGVIVIDGLESRVVLYPATP